MSIYLFNNHHVACLQLSKPGIDNRVLLCFDFDRIFVLMWCVISATLHQEGRRTMPTKNPRVNIVVEPALYRAIHDLATSEGISMSTLARDLIREAINLREDVALAAFADIRMKTFDRKVALTHEDVWE